MTTPEFRDGQTSAQHQPGSTSDDSPRDPQPSLIDGPPGWTRNADGKWVENDGDDVKSDVPASARAVDTGRSAAPTEASKPEQPRHESKVEEKPQSYVWLANGEVVRCNNEDLPQNSGGTIAPHGHWQKDGKVYEIVAVYAVEENAS